MIDLPPRVDSYTPSQTWAPDVRGRWRFLASCLWQMRGELVRMNAVMLVWLSCAALAPWLSGKVVDALGGPTALWWGLALLVATLGYSFLGGVVGIVELQVLIGGTYRHNLLATQKALQLSQQLSRVKSTGEILSLNGSDALAIGALASIVGQSVGALASFCFIVGVMFTTSWQLALVVVLLAITVVAGAVPLMKPAAHLETIARGHRSTLTDRATDIVGGLRILRGIGGEARFANLYRQQSQVTKAAAIKAGWLESLLGMWWWLQKVAMLTGITWIGVTQLLSGHITAGQLVAFFGFALVISTPISTLWRLVEDGIPAYVAAGKAVDFLRHEATADPLEPSRLDPSASLVDDDTGAEFPPATFTILVSAEPDAALACADRLAGIADGESARLGGVPLADAAANDVRATIVLSASGAETLAGTLQDVVDPHGTATRERAEAALHVACAEDVYTSLPEGWASVIDERARRLSGGQRQRLVLARALLHEPPILVLVEPTSAVDAHTESRVAARLVDYRRGRTTIVVSASPLLAHVAERVVFLPSDGRARAGTHRELLADPDYRRVVMRTEEADHG